ncbi:MAG: DUF2284 domain-containing protein [Bacillota bacterium]|jgi:predicted metal-binding protein
MFDYKKMMSEIEGVWEYGLVDTKDLVFLDEVREICKANSCRKYGTTWACPPAVGTMEECREKVMQYGQGLMFTGKYRLRSPFDWKGMMKGLAEFKEICSIVDEKAKEYCRDYFILDVEGCDICEKCTYPDAPCRFPEKMHPSVEGYGMLVSAVAKKAGVRYDNGEGTVTYLGMILFNE